MKKIIFILLFCNSVIGQTINTHVTQYFYFYDDSTKNVSGKCYFDAYIGRDTLVFDILPPNTPSIYIVYERFLPEDYMDGQLLTMNAIDNEGIYCQIKLFIAPNYREVHLIYEGARFGYIYEN
jgi:hypothetical protein